MAYSKIDSSSNVSINSSLNFFQLPPTEVSIARSKIYEILPSNPITDFPLHYRLHASSLFSDLNRFYIYTEFRIRKEGADGKLKDLEAADKVAPINMLGLTFMKNMRVSINGREIFNSNGLMPYKTWIDYETSLSRSAKDGWGGSLGYYRDEDKLEEGTGFDARKELFALSKKACFMAKIDADIFNQPLFLLNHCLLEIEIQPHDSDFLLTSPTTGTTYHLILENCRLYVRMCELHDSLALTINKRLDAAPAKYAVKKSAMKSFYISPGRNEFSANLFMDQIPRRLSLGLVANADFVGQLSKSPLNFIPGGVREISISANGKVVPFVPYNLSYDEGLYVRAYVDSQQAVGLMNTMESNGVTYKQFGKTHCIYVFDLSNSGEDTGGAFDLIETGNCQVNIKFSTPVPTGGLTLICQGELEQVIFLSADRTISTDNSTT